MIQIGGIPLENQWSGRESRNVNAQQCRSVAVINHTKRSGL
jgi:hypothetical protein